MAMKCSLVDPEALTVIANVASHNCSFMLRREHNEMLPRFSMT